MAWRRRAGAPAACGSGHGPQGMQACPWCSMGRGCRLSQADQRHSARSLQDGCKMGWHLRQLVARAAAAYRTRRFGGGCRGVWRGCWRAGAAPGALQQTKENTDVGGVRSICENCGERTTMKRVTVLHGATRGRFVSASVGDPRAAAARAERLRRVCRHAQRLILGSLECSFFVNAIYR